MPATSVFVEPTPCTISPSGASIVMATTPAAIAELSLRMFPCGISSRRRPSKSSAAKRSRERQTQVIAALVSQMITIAPSSREAGSKRRRGFLQPPQWASNFRVFRRTC